MAMKRALSLTIIIFITFFFGCSGSSVVTNIKPEKVVKDIKGLDYSSGIEECQRIIDNSTATNGYTNLTSQKLTSDVVKIEAVPLTIEVIKAMVKKRALERRWPHKDYIKVLDQELDAFTNFRYDKISNKIVPKSTIDTTSSYTMSFKISIENNTDPFRIIEIDGGFECFFLENENGLFGRAEGITDDFLFDYLLIDGFMSTIVTFKTKNDFGQKLFADGKIPEKFGLVFNGIQTDPIKLDWHLSLPSEK